jgi:hypothetical protein
MMFAHALMNAAGHALFAGERVAAENLAHRAMREFELLTADSRETRPWDEKAEVVAGWLVCGGEVIHLRL